METLIFQIETIAQGWFEFMVASSAQLGIFIVLVAFLTLLFRNQSARFLYWIWLIGLLKIFIPPTIKLPAFLSQTRLVLDNTIPTYVFPEIRFTKLPAPELSYQGYLFLFWIFALFILVTFWIFKMLQLNKAVNRSSYDITQKIRAIHDFETSNRIRFFSGPGITMPFTKGLFSPRVYIPESALNWSASELKALIFHEIAHIKGKDILVMAVQNAIQLLYFFHPMVWIANIQISRYREKACDDFAIQALHGKNVEYGKLLLKSIDQVVGWKPIPSMTTYFHQSRKFLIHRFEYILNRKEFIMTKLNSIQKMVLVGLVIVGVVFSCQRKEVLNQPLEAIQTPDLSVDYSKAVLQAGLADSQKVDYDTPPMPVGGYEVLKDCLLFPEFGEKQGTIMNAYINQKGEVYALQYMKGSIEVMKTIKPIEFFALQKFEGKLSRSLHQFKWKAATKNGQPISAWITLPIQYTLKLAPEEIISLSEVPKPPPPVPGEEPAVFVAYDEPPEPIGGFKAIQENLVYPELARKAGIEGTVTVQAQINESGEVINTRIVRSLGENNGCDEAAVAAIKATEWKPAKAKEQPVTVWVSIPVRFKLKSSPTVVAEPITIKSEEFKAKIKELPPPPPPEGTDKDADQFYVPYDEPPQPIGGFGAIQKNLVYPELAVRAGIEGTVTVQARIDETGKVIDTKILVPLGNSGCNEAAVAAIKSVKWKPARQKDKPVTVWISVPVRFNLH